MLVTVFFNSMKSSSLQNNKNLAYCHGDKILSNNSKLLSQLMTLSRHFQNSSCYFLFSNCLPTRRHHGACCCCCCCTCIMFCIMFCIIFCPAVSCSYSFLIAISSLRISFSICVFSLRNSTANPPLFLLLTFLSVLTSSSNWH